MVKDFIALGHDAYLITSVYHDGVDVIPSKSLTRTRGYVFVNDEGLGIPIIRVDSYFVKRPYRRRINFRDFVHVLEKIVDEFKLNVLITHSTLWNGPEEVAKFVAWRRYMRDLGGYKDPIVFCHMSHFQEPSPKRYSLVERAFRMAWNRLSLSEILRTANLVLVVTPLEKEAKIKMGAKEEKCLLFPGGVDEELYVKYAASDTKVFLKKHKLSPDVKLVSYLGTLEERKNTMAILKVAELLDDRRDIHFAIAGRGDSSYANKVRTEASRMQNVTYLGELDEKDKILLIKSSFINLLMSRLEALGLSQLEFMYVGVPVVTSGVGGQSWLIKNGREGMHLTGPEDAEGAAKAIQSLVDDQDLWTRLSTNAKEKARNLTSYKIIKELDDAITEEMIKESGMDHIPPEALLTLAEPEHVLKTWSTGSWAVVATDRRFFVKHGRISRKVIEIPYPNISYIEHTRRFPWKTPLVSLIPAVILLLEPLWRTILKPEFTLLIEQALKEFDAPFSSVVSMQTLTMLFGLVPCAVGIAIFVIQTGIGFNLHCQAMKPIYLPRGLGEAVTFLRKTQDKQRSDPSMEMDEAKQEP
jgi:glycosyltransferase involved in cell wall biosynthesis